MLCDLAHASPHACMSKVAKANCFPTNQICLVHELICRDVLDMSNAGKAVFYADGSGQAAWHVRG